jgi:hypothetical protein
MRMITRTAVALGLGSALVLGSAGYALATPTASPTAPVVLDNHDDGLGGLLGALLGGDDDDDGPLVGDDDDDDGLLGGLLGDDDDDDAGHVIVRCDDDDDDGPDVLDLGGLNLVAVLEGVDVLGLNLGNCDDDEAEGGLEGLGGNDEKKVDNVDLGNDDQDVEDGLLGGLLGGH